MKNRNLILTVSFFVFLVLVMSSNVNALCRTGNVSGYYTTVESGGNCTITIQPNETYAKDAFIFSKNGSLNITYDLSYLLAATWTYSGPTGTHRSFMDFGLNNIFNGTLNSSQVLDAKLSLYWRNEGNLSSVNYLHGAGLSYYNQSSTYLKRVTGTWSESSVNWNNQPNTTTTNQVSVSAPTSTTSNFANLVVTNLVKDTLTYNSQGFELNLQTESTYRSITIGSSGNSNTANRPKLIIVYPKS